MSDLAVIFAFYTYVNRAKEDEEEENIKEQASFYAHDMLFR